MKYSQLTLDEIIHINAYLQDNFSYSKIAEKLGRYKSTISREIKRNTGRRGYRWKKAHCDCEFRKIHSKKNIRLTKEIEKTIKSKLLIQWSPEQISRWIFINEKLSISHETIYKMIRLNKQLGGTLYKNLRQGSHKRRKSYASGKSSKGSIKNRISIDKRPKIVEL
jgi:IS30 family transposase